MQAVALVTPIILKVRRAPKCCMKRPPIKLPTPRPFIFLFFFFLKNKMKE